MDILTMHLHGDKDSSPLEFISAARLAYYRQCAAVVEALYELSEEPEKADELSGNSG